MGRRRQRVRRLPQWLRRHVRLARPPGDRARGVRAGGARVALRRADRRLDRGRRGTAPALRPAAVALLQLGHRVDDGGDPSRPRRDRARRRAEDGGLLPRPSRLGDGVRAPAARSARRSRRAVVAAVRRRPSRRDQPAHQGRAVQRRRRALEQRCSGSTSPRDRRAGDDEHHDRRAARRLSGARARAVRCARREADLRRGQDRLHDRRRRRSSASVSGPTWSAWPRRSAAATPAARSG